MITTTRMRRAAWLLLCLLAVPLSAQAQDNPLASNARFLYNGIKPFLRGSAEKMPEQYYGFKPTEAVRSFGQILGHVADAQYRFCSIALSEKNPAPGIEKTRTTKPELIAALEEAFRYCDRAYDSMTDATAAEMLKLGPGMPRLGVLTVNSLHATEHYGNLITYMRMKNVVPPSSDPAYMPQPQKK